MNVIIIVILQQSGHNIWHYFHISGLLTASLKFTQCIILVFMNDSFKHFIASQSSSEQRTVSCNIHEPRMSYIFFCMEETFMYIS